MYNINVGAGLWLFNLLVRILSADKIDFRFVMSEIRIKFGSFFVLFFDVLVFILKFEQSVYRTVKIKLDNCLKV